MAERRIERVRHDTRRRTLTVDSVMRPTPHMVRIGFVKEGHGMVAQLDQLDIHIVARLRLLQDPLCRDIGEVGGASGADDDGNSGPCVHRKSPGES